MTTNKQLKSIKVIESFIKEHPDLDTQTLKDCLFQMKKDAFDDLVELARLGKIDMVDLYTKTMKYNLDETFFQKEKTEIFEC